MDMLETGKRFPSHVTQALNLVTRRVIQAAEDSALRPTTGPKI
jgi:hypothetical protein